jgi:hypothetical protein
MIVNMSLSEALQPTLLSLHTVQRKHSMCLGRTQDLHITVQPSRIECSNWLYCSCCTTYVCIHCHPLGEENTATTPDACPGKTVSRPSCGYRSAQARHLYSSTCRSIFCVVGLGVSSNHHWCHLPNIHINPNSNAKRTFMSDRW